MAKFDFIGVFIACLSLQALLGCARNVDDAIKRASPQKLRVVEGQILVGLGAGSEPERPHTGASIQVFDREKLRSELRAVLSARIKEIDENQSTRDSEYTKYTNLVGLHTLGSISEYYSDSEGRFKVAIPDGENWVLFARAHVKEKTFERSQVWILEISPETIGSYNVLGDANCIHFGELERFAGLRK